MMVTRIHLYCVCLFLISALPFANAGECRKSLQSATSLFAALSVVDPNEHGPCPFAGEMSDEVRLGQRLQSIGLTSIARVYACQGDIASAIDTLENISTSSFRDRGYVAIVHELAMADMRSDAERMCYDMQSINTSISCLASVAQSWRIAGNRREAYRVLRQAVSLVNNSNVAADDLEDIRFILAYGFASLDDLSETIRFASLGSDTFEEGEMLLSLCLDFDLQANVRKALQDHIRVILSTIPEAGRADSLRGPLAILAAQDGEYEITFNEVDQITSHRVRDYYRSKCIEVGATSFSLRELECQLGQIEDEVVAISASTRLATSMYGLGRIHTAMRLLEQAEFEIAQLEGERYIQGVRLVSTAYADVGNFAEAIRICKEHTSATARSAYAVAERMLQHDQVDVFQDFLTDVGEFEGRNEALATLVALQVKSLSFEEAWNNVMQIESGAQRSIAIIYIALAYIEVGDVSQAIDILDTRLDTLASADVVRRSVVSSLIRQGALHHALKQCLRIQNHEDRSELLHKLGMALVRRGNSLSDISDSDIGNAERGFVLVGIAEQLCLIESTGPFSRFQSCEDSRKKRRVPHRCRLRFRR